MSENLKAVPGLVDLIGEPGRIADLPPETIPALRGSLAELDSLLLQRLFASSTSGGRQASKPNRYLSAKETATRMGVCLDYVYKHAEEFPFAAKEGRRVLFSEEGLERYLHDKMAKN